jgi:RND family efflux transporter MFP subunit
MKTSPWKLVAGAMAVIVGISACGHKDAPSSRPEPPAAVAVKSAPSTLERIPLSEAVVGTVRPKLEATVSAKIAGRILEVLVVPGQQVKAGDRLAVLEAGELEAARNRAQAALEQAKRELERQKQLLAANATSRSAFDAAEAAEQMAAASLVEIQTTLEHAIVTAPFAGTISRKLADTGDLAIPGRGIVQLEDPKLLRLETPVPESLAGKLKLGQPISVTLDAIGGTNLEGTIGEMAPSADSASRTFMVRIDLPNVEGLRAGLFGRAHFPLGNVEAVLAPVAALRRVGQMETVFQITDGKARLRLVRTVPAGPAKVRVLSGLDAGAVLVLDPPATLADGHPVTVTP